MKKFFLERANSMSKENISPSDIASYKALLVAELEKMGATDSEISLVHEATIRNSIINKRRPEDVAWAILQ